MKTIGSICDLADVQGDLGKFIRKVSPWLEEHWDAEECGYIFIIDDDDVGVVKSVFTAPHITNPDEVYTEVMTIDLESFDYWEEPSFEDDVTGYWNVVAVLGADYGCSVFMSPDFVKSIPKLHRRLQEIRR